MPPVEYITETLWKAFQVKFAGLSNVLNIDQDDAQAIIVQAILDDAHTFDGHYHRFNPANDYGRFVPLLVEEASQRERPVRLGKPFTKIVARHHLADFRFVEEVIQPTSLAELEELYESARAMANQRAGQPDESQWRQIAVSRLDKLEQAKNERS